MIGFSLGVGACYCGATYYINRHYVKEFIRLEKLSDKAVAAAIFVASPITVPLGLALMIVMH